MLFSWVFSFPMSPCVPEVSLHDYLDMPHLFTSPSLLIALMCPTCAPPCSSPSSLPGCCVLWARLSTSILDLIPLLVFCMILYHRVFLCILIFRRPHERYLYFGFCTPAWVFFLFLQVCPLKPIRWHEQGEMMLHDVFLVWSRDC